MDFTQFTWTREPACWEIKGDKIEITTSPYTDLWQRTYYHFQNDSAPVFQMETAEPYFSFVVKTDFQESGHRFDQCGVVMYLDRENWLKGSIEYEKVGIPLNQQRAKPPLKRGDACRWHAPIARPSRQARSVAEGDGGLS